MFKKISSTKEKGTPSFNLDINLNSSSSGEQSKNKSNLGIELESDGVKKKPKLDMEIGLHEIEVEEEKETKSQSGLPKLVTWGVGVTVLVIGGMIAYGSLSKPAEQSQQTQTSEVVVLPTTTISDEESERDNDTSNVMSPISDEDKIIESTNSQIEPSVVEYKNGLVNLSLEYPQSWYVNERTNESLGVIKESVSEGVFDNSKTVLKESVPVVDLTPSDDYETSVSVLLVPKESLSEVTNGVLNMFLGETKKIVTNPNNDDSSNEVTASGSNDVDGLESSEVEAMYESMSTDYFFEEYGVTYRARQYILDIGVSSIAINAVTLASNDADQRLITVDTLVRSIKTF